MIYEILKGCLFIFFPAIHVQTERSTMLFISSPLCSGFTFTLCLSLASSSVTVNSGLYEEGKRQYEVMQQQASMPRYGQCWKNAMITIQSGCKTLTDKTQARLALAYLNCFLEVRIECTFSIVCVFLLLFFFQYYFQVFR